MKVKCSHILFKHKESRRPFDSYRNKPVTRSKQQAFKQIQKIQERVKEDPSIFKQLAKQVSQCSSAQNGGSLGFFGKDEMQKAFEVAAFNLNIGQISGIIQTESGLHIILRQA